MEPASTAASMVLTSILMIATGPIGTTTFYVKPEMMALMPHIVAVPEAGSEEASPEPMPAPAAAPEPELVPEPEPTTQAPIAEAEPEPVLPSFDVVRVDEAGETLIAGNAEPGSEVIVLVDGNEVGESTADSSGRFVSFLTLLPSETPRVMSLRAVLGDAAVNSDETVIISPFAAPLAVAEIEPAPDSATDLHNADEPLVEETVAEAEIELTQPPVQTADVDAPAAPAEPVDQADVAETSDTLVALAQPSNLNTPDSSDAATRALAGEAAPELPRPTAPRLLLADDAGVRVLQSPETLTEVALDSISYDDTGEVSLAGRAQGDGFVRIYIDDRPVTTSRIEQNGTWRTGLPNVDSGVYTLRVDELDDSGVVTSRIETPFRREEPAIVAEITSEPGATELLTQSSLTVQPGATLWAISTAKYGEGRLFVKIFDANRDRIRDPDLIFPGQVFDLPD